MAVLALRLKAPIAAEADRRHREGNARGGATTPGESSRLPLATDLNVSDWQRKTLPRVAAAVGTSGTTLRRIEQVIAGG